MIHRNGKYKLYENSPPISGIITIFAADFFKGEAPQASSGGQSALFQDNCSPFSKFTTTTIVTNIINEIEIWKYS